MRVLILGGNGRTGELATSKALEQGYTVTVLVRKTSSMKPWPGLSVVQGTPLEQANIEQAFAATPDDPVHAVLVTLNASRESDSPFSKPVAPSFFIRDCVRNVTAVMAQHNVKRIIIMSSFGTGSSFAQLAWPMKLTFKYTNMKLQLEDHDAVDAEVRGDSTLDWTLVRPAMLKEGEAAPVKEFGEAGEGVGLLSGITRASVADFMVKAIAEESWTKRAIVITN